MRRNMTSKNLSAGLLAAIFLCAFFSCVSAVPAAAQYTDSRAMADLGGPKEFERRRHALAQEILAQEKNGGWVILFARQVEPEAEHYREDNDFYYLTGIADPGAVLAINAKSGLTVLFEPAQAPRKAKVYGPNVLSLPKEEQAKLGFPV